MNARSLVGKDSFSRLDTFLDIGVYLLAVLLYNLSQGQHQQNCTSELLQDYEKCHSLSAKWKNILVGGQLLFPKGCPGLHYLGVGQK